MEKRSEHVVKLLHKKNFINQWIKGKYKDKSLIIYGSPGIGKTSLANYILRDFIKIEINIDFCKSGKSLIDYLNLSLYKKSITMMFEKEKKKALLFDDLKYIQENDKSLFKQVLDFSKNKNLNFPVIYIFNTVTHKLVQTIYNKTFPIHISFNKNLFTSMVQNYYDDNDRIDYLELSEKSNFNFHNIQINIQLYKENTNKIHTYRKREDELSHYIKKIYKIDCIKDLYNYIISDYNTISLNILDNCHNWIFQYKKLSYYKKIILLLNIYNSYCISDNHHILLQRNNDWDLIDHVIMNSSVFPMRYLSLSKIKIEEIVYNKYLSRSIIYTHNNKILDSNYLNYKILECLYSVALHSNTNKLKEICSYYNVSKKCFDKFIKYFISDHKNKHFKKLFKN